MSDSGKGGYSACGPATRVPHPVECVCVKCENARWARSGTKPTIVNPKDKIGSRKIDVGLVPDSAVVGMAIALTEGAVKYGRFNWRIAGVSARIYHAACRRHLKKWWGGQDEDVATTVHHIDSAMACLAILRDAMLYGMLTDDRPPAPNENAMAEFVDAAEKKQAWLVELFKDHAPKQYTIADTRADTARQSSPEQS